MRVATYRLWIVRGLNSRAVEEEAHALRGLALALAEGVHELLQLRGPLDLEEDLVVVIRHLDVQVLRRRDGAVVGPLRVVGGV